MNDTEKLEIVKNYLNVDFEDDDNLIKALIESGEEYLHNAGVEDTKKKVNFTYWQFLFSYTFIILNVKERLKITVI